MAVKSTTSKLFEFILPKKKSSAGGSSYTDTFDPSNTTQTLSLPDYQDHLENIYDTRTSENSLELVKSMMINDPDMSAAVNAFLTVSDTDIMYVVRDSSGQINRDGQKLLNSLMYKVFEITDYSFGYQKKMSFHETVTSMRYMLLMRGSLGAELVYDKTMSPDSIRLVDMSTIKYKETSSGVFKPYQTTNTVTDLSLDIPTFFTVNFNQDPTSVYTYSYFTSAINTIAARQIVIADLYRIMRVVGFPRVALEVIEEVLKKRVPENLRNDPVKMTSWINDQLRAIGVKFDGLRSDSVFVHTDAIKPKIINDVNPGSSLQVSEIINTLNAQNQAGLKVVATVLGRGEAGVNTASVESRIFSVTADSINKPIADIMSRIFTLALRTAGFDGFVTFSFRTAEMRSDLELESQKIQKQTRLQKDLSLGIITDEDYCMQMYGRVPNDDSPVLSGTNFLEAVDTVNEDINVEDTKRDNSLGRELTPEGADGAKSNAVNPE